MTSVRVPSLVVAGLGLVVLAAACGSKHDYAGAAATAGLGVAGAAAYRATTGGCWGQCLNGMVCDRASGMCVAHSTCTQGCAPNERCQEGVVGRCVPIVDKGDNGNNGETNLDAGAREAGAADAAMSGADDGAPSRGR